MNHFLEKVELLVMPLHEELFRDVERLKKKKEEEEEEKKELGSLPRKLFRNVYTLSKIKFVFKKKRKLNRLGDYCGKN